MPESKLTYPLISVAQVQEAKSRLANVALKTPFMKNYNLSEKFEANIFLKREDLQSVRSFKIRGAYNKIVSLSEGDLQNGIVCASAGNHAQGFALACHKLRIRGKVYMPHPTPKQKLTKVKHFGKEWIEVILTGDTFDDAYNAALKDCQQNYATLIHPFDDLDVIAGQGTVAAEILEQSEVQLDILLVAVGGGGLISGVGSYFKAMSPKTKLYAVESEGAPTLYKSMAENKICTLDKIDTFADGIAVKRIGDITFGICQQVVDKNILVPEGKICSTILQLYNDEAIVAEPAGAVSIAALDQIVTEIKGKNIGIIICGGNNDIQRTQEIRERALLYEGRKHYFIIRFPQRAGALKDFLEVLGPEDDIAHFQYTKKNNRENGPALVGIELKNPKDFNAIQNRMLEKEINFQHINNNPMLFEMLV